LLIDDPDLPGFVRVVANAHAKEMTDVDGATRDHLMRAVFLAEQVVREVMTPHKINLASLGNAVPHVHWHVIPRFADDAFFPQPIWGTRQRETAAPVLAERRSRLPRLKEELARVFSAAR
jgi:diadenosine tetraphosphate (Ap4A) HIT family hydrolase